MPNPATQARSQGMKKYQVLTNVSVPFPGSNPDHRTFLVQRGEVVELTAEQAHNLMTQHRIPVIREVKEQHQPFPFVGGMALSGMIRQPASPATMPQDHIGPRPDPPGSSKIIQQQPVPTTAEAQDPQPGTEQASPSALDLAPGTRIQGMTKSDL